MPHFLLIPRISSTSCPSLISSCQPFELLEQLKGKKEGREFLRNDNYMELKLQDRVSAEEENRSANALAGLEGD